MPHIPWYAYALAVPVGVALLGWVLHGRNKRKKPTSIRLDI